MRNFDFGGRFDFIRAERSFSPPIGRPEGCKSGLSGSDIREGERGRVARSNIQHSVSHYARPSLIRKLSGRRQRRLLLLLLLYNSAPYCRHSVAVRSATDKGNFNLVRRFERAVLPVPSEGE